MASFGSSPLFHIVGITPEAPTLADVCDGTPPTAIEITGDELDALRQTLGGKGDKLDVVVFAAPQHSIVEMQQVAGLLNGQKIHDDTSLIVCTSPSVQPIVIAWD